MLLEISAFESFATIWDFMLFTLNLTNKDAACCTLHAISTASSNDWGFFKITSFCKSERSPSMNLDRSNLSNNNLLSLVII